MRKVEGLNGRFSELLTELELVKADIDIMMLAAG